MRRSFSDLTSNVGEGRVEDGRGGLGHSASLRFLSPLIEPEMPTPHGAGGNW
jgi:hypothetical protein